MTTNQFEQWLDSQRDQRVSEVFHEIVERAAALDSATAQPVAMTDERIEPLLQSLCEAIKDELDGYRCTHIRDGDDGQRGYPLVDLLTLPGDKDIQRGHDEIEMIADAMYHAIKPVLSRALSAQAAPKVPEAKAQAVPEAVAQGKSTEDPAEDLRIALAQRDIAIEGRDREFAKVQAMRAALDFAAGAIGDAIYTEDGLDGNVGQRVLHIITEARELGTFDQQQFGALDHLCPFTRAENAEAVLSAAPQPPAPSEQRKPLAEERIHRLRCEAKADPRTMDQHWFVLFARAIEAAHGIRSTGGDHE